MKATSIDNSNKAGDNYNVLMVFDAIENICCDLVDDLSKDQQRLLKNMVRQNLIDNVDIQSMQEAIAALRPDLKIALFSEKGSN